jgi:hypothetical protein
MNPRYLRVAQRARHRCEYCHAPEVVFNFPFEVEHVIQTTRQGADDEENLALGCRSCNVRKSDRTTGRDEVTGEEVPLFHPRRDRWEQHFQVDPDSGEIIGVTPVGRVTCSQLDLNAPAQLQARYQWMRLHLFP